MTTLTLRIAALSFGGMLATGAAAQSKFDEILAGARKEAAVVVWASTPNLESTHRALIDAFNKRFDLKTKLEWLVIHPSRSVGRLIAETAAGRVGPDLTMCSRHDLHSLSEKGLLKSYPWIDTFSSNFPTIRETLEQDGKGPEGAALTWFHNVYGLAWNMTLIKAEQLPTRIDELPDPKWKGRFVISSLATPYNLLALDMGAEKAIDLARRTLANRPVIKNSTPNVSSAITSGEAHFGISSFFNADRAKSHKEPQEFRFFDDYVPMISTYICVPERSPNPNTARLFAAWMVTEGARTTEALESASRMTDPASKLAKAMAGHSKSATVVTERTSEDVKLAREVTAKIGRMITGK